MTDLVGNEGPNKKVRDASEHKTAAYMKVREDLSIEATMPLSLGTSFQRGLLSAEQIAAIFETFQSLTPHPQTELKYHDAYTLLVAVVLSAQATDKGVNKATEGLFQRVKTPQDMLDLGLDALKDYIKTIGLYNTKALNIMKLSEILVTRYRGQVPSTRDDLQSLPGVGRKTANVVLNVYFGQETMAVDTHIFRVSNRLGLTAGKTPVDVEEQLLARIPKIYLQHAHHWLILHGRYICKARKPLCDACPFSGVCSFYAENVCS